MDLEYLGPLIVNIDLVVPAIIKKELNIIKRLNTSTPNDGRYLNQFIISPKHMLSFAIGLKSLHFGRVVVNFTEKDALEYLRRKPNVYKEVDNSQIFEIKFSEYTEEAIQDFIDNLVSEINYHFEVLRDLDLIA